MTYKFGRKPRRFDARIPHFSALRLKLTLPTAPPSIDYTTGLPANPGMMLNNQLADCGEAGFFHGVQVWSQNASGSILTVPDATVEQLYEDGGGYVPGNPSTDQGTDLQSLLSFLVTTGALMPDGTRHKITAFFEVDPRNQGDIDLVTAECGAVYVGFNVPAFFQALEAPGSLWDVNPSADNTIVDGHCIVSAAYQPNQQRGVISWGSKAYQMTAAFWGAFVDECYAIIDPLFLKATGKTPFGLAEADWAAQMAAIQGYAPAIAIPVPHDPQLILARADRSAAQARAVQAEARATRAESIAAELRADRDRQAGRTLGLEKQADVLQRALNDVQAERDHLQSQARAPEVHAGQGGTTESAPVVP